MTEDHGIGVVNFQRLQQGMQGCLLLPGASVGVTAFRGQAAFVANADGVLVIVPGMGTDKILMPGLVQLTIAFDVVVITYALAVESGVVAGPEHINSKPLIAACGTAMDNDKIDLSGHCSAFLE